jgi:hypothetical protein
VVLEDLQYLTISLKKALERTARLQTVRETQLCTDGKSKREGQHDSHGLTERKENTMGEGKGSEEIDHGSLRFQPRRHTQIRHYTN